jgi:hypothetical protein
MECQPSRPASRALLVGSSYGNLPGTENDVNTMSRILQGYAFGANERSYVKRLCGDDATRQNILNEWDQLISESSWGDAVVIYYSGHGGIAESKKEDPEGRLPGLLQFLIPSDFDTRLEQWRGILDSEISQLLFRTTGKTPNVTYILDCCHSARLGRGPQRMNAQAKILAFDYETINKHMEPLRHNKKLLENDLWMNPNVVRIAAAADREAAWQYQNAKGQHVGILTEKLAVMMESVRQLSWRNIMLGTKALVETEFDDDCVPQQPRSAGADTRIPFSLNQRASIALLAVIGDEYTIIQGGRIHGIREGDTYTLIPFQKSQGDTEDTSSGVTQAATVDMVNGFSAVVYDITKEKFPFSEALALPSERKHRWPVVLPDDPPYIRELFGESRIFKGRDGETPLVEIRRDSDIKDRVTLYGQGVLLAQSEVDDLPGIESLVSAAHIFAESQETLSSGGGRDDERFTPTIEVEVGAVVKRKKNPRGHYRSQ